MLKRHRSVAALAALALAVPACASGGANPTGGLGGNGGGASASTTASGTATASSGATGSGGGGGTGGGPTGGCKKSGDTVLAVDRLYFGDANWDDSTNTTTGWTLFGFNLDGLSSTSASTDVCKPSSGASPGAVYPDGPAGLDNAFGKLVLPVFLANIPSLSSQANAALINGDFSILVRLGGLTSGADQASLPGKVYGGDFLQIQPLFDGTDCWPVTPESLTDPADIESAKLSFPTSKLTANHWDSVGTGDLQLTLKVLSFEGQVTIHHTRISMDLSPSHDGTDRGMIGGVLDTEEFVKAINALMGSFDPAQCGGANMMAIDTQLRQASDILKDGTQSPGSVCDGISIGLGFKAKRVQFGAIGDPLAVPPNPCP
jgi:hypothetical protein